MMDGIGQIAEPEDLEAEEDPLVEPDEEDLEEGDLGAHLQSNDVAGVEHEEPELGPGHSALPLSEEGEEEEEEAEDEDVEASLDEILKERLVVDEEVDEEVEPEERGENSDRVLPKQPGEFVCQSCFLLKHRSQLADPARGLCRDCV